MPRQDYFEHFQEIQRTFVFEDEQNLTAKVAQFNAEIINSLADLRPLIQKQLHDIRNISLKKIYNFRINQYVEFQSLNSAFLVPRKNLEDSPGVVLIKYSKSVSETLIMNSVDSKINQEKKSEPFFKGERSKERIILQVIKIVKKWRSLHETIKIKAISLPQAAKKLGMSKKSLDDYYYQLKMGEKYKFDFHGHMMDGVGVLRQFLKQIKSNYRNQKSQNLPTFLKIANQIDQYEYFLDSDNQQEKVERLDEQKNEQILQDPIKENQFKNIFYNHFNCDFETGNDSFINLGKPSYNLDMLKENMGNRNNFDLFF